ncbi:MAG: TIGR02234 family membrane protein [Propionibacteriales bacterium]|nr:TIGR02234 family membrane protein [Propionibacteriales bacterium]
MRWRFGAAVLAGLFGGALVVWGAGEAWDTDPLGSAAGAGEGSGSLAGSLGAVVLAGSAVVAVTRAVGRRLAGLLVAVAGAVTVYVAAVADGGWSAWRVLVLAGGVLAVCGGVPAAARGHRWPSMSQRYDAPSARDESHESDPWRALDRGEDPTL